MERKMETIKTNEELENRQLKNNEHQVDPTVKKKFWLVRLWNYYSTYEKIWLFSIISIGVALALLFPDDSREWLMAIEIVAIIGGCSCELLLSKQSKWAFIVSFFLYDTAQTVVYFVTGLYISALFEIIYWIPMLFISFYFWNKQKDNLKNYLTQVKKVNFAKELAIFIGILIISLAVGALFTTIGVIAEGLSEWWYLDALANTFSVCNGLFLLFRYREQWLPWIGVALVEATLWILNGQYIMLVLSLGYLMNSTYGFIMWTKYIRKHKKEEEQEVEVPAVAQAE